MKQYLLQEITFLSGVGPKKAELFQKELQIFTFEDLLRYYPFKYIDRSKIYSIREINSQVSYIQLRGKVTSFSREGTKFKERLVARFTDGTGIVELVFFHGIKYVLENIKIGTEYILFGKPSIFNGKLNFIHPELEDVTKFNQAIGYQLQPFYNTSEKLKRNYINSKMIQKLLSTLWKGINFIVEDPLPGYILQGANLLPLHEALLNIHFPQSSELLGKAQFRLKFEELFLIQLDLLYQKAVRISHLDGLIFSTAGSYLHRFYNEILPFPLTEAQKRVLKEIRHDLGSGKQMNRLLQGDVGSGKTLVAFMTMLIAAANGFQSCMIVPTEILANQHYKSILKFLGEMPLRIEVLTGSTTKAVRKKLHAALLDGSLHILVGTHAVLEDVVQFQNLGLVIVDEQHRFGVAQRAKLWQKNDRPPHILVMTATPIPRTLAMTLYGDLDVSVIDELPPGRKPIQTLHYYDSKRLVLFGFIRRQIAAGRQVYVVYPLIGESENLDLKYLEDGFEAFSQAFPMPDYYISVVHGKMKSEEKRLAMQEFALGKTHIMIATTVIEVGVDVPNASVMVIESAERFGLSQLHQLRGRVGRGAEQSYCVLMSSYKLTNEARKRIEAMVSTNDGFELAELDLKLRGPGDIEGTQQSGMPFDLKIANIARDGQILQIARDFAIDTLDKDPLLERDVNRLLKNHIMNSHDRAVNWGIIS